MSRVIFRVDGNSQIGLGHVMRCLSIADACRRLGSEVIFVLADHEVVDLICLRGYNALILNSDYRELEKELTKWGELDFDFCAKSDEETVVLVVDSYFVTKEYFRALKMMLNKGQSYGTGKLAYLDDLEAFPYPVDALINYNVYAGSRDYEALYQRDRQNGEILMPKLLLGVMYAPLREQFYNAEKRKQNKVVKDVLVLTGGADPKHLALALIREIKRRLVSGDKFAERCIFHILIGGANIDADKIQEMAESVPCVVVHENVFDMKRLICSCDVAISAAGSSTYEICACGVPMVTYVLADNQLRGAEGLERNGLAVNFGDLEKELGSENGAKENMIRAAGKLLDVVGLLSEDHKRRVEIGNKMQEIIDGRGADRLVKELLGFD